MAERWTWDVSAHPDVESAIGGLNGREMLANFARAIWHPDEQDSQ